MKIRRLTSKDRETWIKMTKDFYQSDAVICPVPEEYFTKTFDMLTAGSPFLDGFAAEENEKVVAALQLSLTWSNEAGGLVVWLEELYVQPELRGRGVGTALIRRAMEEYAGKAARFRLEVAPGNPRARALYERLGFRELGYTSMIVSTACADAAAKS